MLVHLRLCLDFLDQFNYLLCDGIGSGDDPILILTEEDDVLLVSSHLRNGGQGATNLSHLGSAFVHGARFSHELK